MFGCSVLTTQASKPSYFDQTRTKFVFWTTIRFLNVWNRPLFWLETPKQSGWKFLTRNCTYDFGICLGNNWSYGVFIIKNRFFIINKGLESPGFEILRIKIQEYVFFPIAMRQTAYNQITIFILKYVVA